MMERTTQEAFDHVVSMLKVQGTEIRRLRSRIADLEVLLDDLPKMTALYQAVKEIQEQYEKPGMTFSHYLAG